MLGRDSDQILMMCFISFSYNNTEDIFIDVRIVDLGLSCWWHWRYDPEQVPCIYALSRFSAVSQAMCLSLQAGLSALSGRDASQHFVQAWFYWSARSSPVLWMILSLLFNKPLACWTKIWARFLAWSVGCSYGQYIFLGERCHHTTSNKLAELRPPSSSYQYKWRKQMANPRQGGKSTNLHPSWPTD